MTEIPPLPLRERVGRDTPSPFEGEGWGEGRDTMNNRRIPEYQTARARELRRDQTPIESKLWQRLRNGGLNGYKFRRQSPIGPYIADFYCARCGLVVELDGESHGCREGYDKARTEWMNANGYRVMRFSNQEVGQRLDAVLETILNACEETTLTPVPSPWEGEG